MSSGGPAHDVLRHGHEPVRAKRFRISPRIAGGALALVVTVTLLAEYGPWQQGRSGVTRPVGAQSSGRPARYVDPVGATADPSVAGWTASGSLGRLSIGFRVSSRQHDPMTLVAVHAELAGAALTGVTTGSRAGGGQVTIAPAGAPVPASAGLPVQLHFALPGDGCQSVRGPLSVTLYLRYHDLAVPLVVDPGGPWPDAYERATGCTGGDPRVPAAGRVVVPLRHGRGNAVLGAVRMSPALRVTINCPNGQFVWLDLGPGALVHVFCTGTQQSVGWAGATGVRTLRVGAGPRVRWAVVVWSDPAG